jgi:dihydroorotase
MKDYDLLIRASRVCCPASDHDGPGSVGIKEDRIVAFGSEVSGSARRVLEISEGVVLPGLVDFHAHPAHGDSKYGIDPDDYLLSRGVTTAMSQGDAGAANIKDYIDKTIHGSDTRVVLAINLSKSGESMAGGCFSDPADLDIAGCIGAIRDHPDEIWGISVNTSTIACGDTDPDTVLAAGLEVAEKTDLPILFGSRRHPDRTLASQLSKLRPGDAMTYCYHNMPQAIVKEGEVVDEVWGARERGVLFDLGHGIASFSFETARVAVEQGFFPDTISSDQYVRHVGLEPPHGLARSMSKLVALGIPESRAFELVTAAPARHLRLNKEVGALRPGLYADLAVLSWNPSSAPLSDAQGVEHPGGCWEPAITIKSGQIVSQGDF